MYNHLGVCYIMIIVMLFKMKLEFGINSFLPDNCRLFVSLMKSLKSAMRGGRKKAAFRLAEKCVEGPRPLTRHFFQWFLSFSHVFSLYQNSVFYISI